MAECLVYGMRLDHGSSLIFVFEIRYIILFNYLLDS